MGVRMIGLDVFGYGRLQDFSALLNTAVANGVTDVRALQVAVAEHMRTERLDVRRQGPRLAVQRAEYAKTRPGRQQVRGMSVCRVCGSTAIVERINVCPSTRVGGPWKTSITCTSRDCLHVELSEKEVKELVRR